jgi:hypothetical protein
VSRRDKASRLFSLYGILYAVSKRQGKQALLSRIASSLFRIGVYRASLRIGGIQGLHIDSSSNLVETSSTPLPLYYVLFNLHIVISQ